MPSVWGNPNWIAGSSSTPPIGGTVSQQAWRTFLKALVQRYGPGGEYWGARYHQQFGANATPLPVTSWQIWNEPNLKKYFAPSPVARAVRAAPADLLSRRSSRWTRRPRWCWAE